MTMRRLGLAGVVLAVASAAWGQTTTTLPFCTTPAANSCIALQTLPSTSSTSTTTSSSTLTTSSTTSSSTTTSTSSTTIAGGGAAFSHRVGGTIGDAVNGCAGSLGGDVFTGGTFRGSATVSGGSTMVATGTGSCGYVIKYNPSGTIAWQRQFCGSAAGTEIQTKAVARLSTGDVIATGTFSGTNADFGGATVAASGSSDGYIVKVNGTTGAWIGQRTFGGISSDEATAVAADASGNYVVTGFFRGTANFGGSNLTVPFGTDLDVFVAKYNGSMVHQWSRNYTNTGNDRGYGVATDASGNAFVVGSFSNDLNFGLGTMTALNAQTDMYVAKLAAATGAGLWQRQLGAASGNELAYAVGVRSNGDVALCGVAVSTMDMGTGSLPALGGSDGMLGLYTSAAGTPVWSKRIGGTGNDYCYGLAVDAANDRVVATGQFIGTADFSGTPLTSSVGSADVYTLVYNAASGAFISVRGDGGTVADQGNAACVTAGGKNVSAGFFNGTATFNGVALVSAGAADAYVMRLP